MMNINFRYFQYAKITEPVPGRMPTEILHANFVLFFLLLTLNRFNTDIAVFLVDIECVNIGRGAAYLNPSE